MDEVNKGLTNQAIGLLPLLIFLILNNFFSYLLSFTFGIILCFVGVFLFQVFKKDKIYQFMLLPTSLTLIVYSFLMCSRLDTILFVYSEIVVESILVTILICTEFFKSRIYKSFRDDNVSTYRKTERRNVLNEFFYLAQILKNIYTLHLFLILFFDILPVDMKNSRFECFSDNQLVIWLGFAVFAYETVRVNMLTRKLNKEIWLPVLNDNGVVVGCVARQVAVKSNTKYFYPIVRVAVVYKGMLYLVNRKPQTLNATQAVDYPFCSYVIFKHSIENTVKRLTSSIKSKKDTAPRFQLRYTFENEQVKHQVNLFVLRIKDEEEFKRIKTTEGKLWTVAQIKENLGTGLFSDHFEEEFEYLNNTVLFAENFQQALN